MIYHIYCPLSRSQVVLLGKNHEANIFICRGCWLWGSIPIPPLPKNLSPYIRTWNNIRSIGLTELILNIQSYWYWAFTLKKLKNCMKVLEVRGLGVGEWSYSLFHFYPHPAQCRKYAQSWKIQHQEMKHFVYFHFVLLNRPRKTP